MFSSHQNHLHSLPEARQTWTLETSNTHNLIFQLFHLDNYNVQCTFSSSYENTQAYCKLWISINLESNRSQREFYERKTPQEYRSEEVPVAIRDSLGASIPLGGLMKQLLGAVVWNCCRNVFFMITKCFHITVQLCRLIDGYTCNHHKEHSKVEVVPAEFRSWGLEVILTYGTALNRFSYRSQTMICRRISVDFCCIPSRTCDKVISKHKNNFSLSDVLVTYVQLFLSLGLLTFLSTCFWEEFYVK